MNGLIRVFNLTMEKFAFIYLLWTIFLISKLSAQECNGKSEEGNEKCAYIFSSPRSMKTGATNQLNLRRYGNLDPGVINVTVMYQDSYTSNESVAIQKTYQIDEGVSNSFLPLYLPKFDNYVYNGRLILNGTCGDCVFRGSDKLYFTESKDILVLIQTDKPIYKAEQEVKFRVLIMDKTLKPVDEIGNIYIEEPTGNRVAQWKNVSLGEGIKQFEFPLLDEPTKGDWKISASFKGEVTTTTFEVKEYVLPKFEVTIELPPYVLINAETIPITVCAKYTYGKSVQGQLHMNISLETYSWSNEKFPYIEYEGDIDGCFDYVINVSRIQSGEDYYSYRRPQIFCEVEEADTGVKRNVTEYIQRQSSPYSLNFYRDTKFKAGLPYSGKVHAKNPDNSPAQSEPIQICYTCTKERVVMNGEWKATRTVKYCKNYTTDEEGAVHFIVPRQNTDTVGINIEAKSLKYAQKKTKTERGVQPQSSLSQPQTSMSLTPWFSPSGSFMQIQQVNGPLPCGATSNIKVLFTAKDDIDFKLYFQVISQGKIIKVGSVDKCFTTSEDVSEKYENKDLIMDHTQVQIVPHIEPSTGPSSSESSSSESKDDECQSVKEARYVPFIGEVDIKIPVEGGSSNIYVLAYYIHQNNEVIADSQKFNVEKCFKNQVKLQFGDDVKQPGTKTSIKVTSSPNSLCGIKLVDKSVSLLNSNDQLTSDKVFSIIESFDNGMYYGVNHCNEDVRQPGLYASSSRILPPRPWSSSSFDDSLAAFETAGLLVMSNLIMFTRPCKSRDGGGNIVYEDSSFNGFGGAVHSKVAMASTARRPAAPHGVRAPAAAEKLGDVAATKSVVDVRNYFPDTWLFELEMTGPDGVYATKEKLPHTITEWVGSAVCINKEDGLGISNATTIRGFQAFFIDMTVPYSIIRGEKVTITVSLFNYLDNPFPVDVSLDDVEGMEVDGDSHMKCVCLKPGPTNFKYKLAGVELGKQNITVRAESSTSCDDACGSDSAAEVVARDAIERSIIIQPEGFPVEESKTALICTEGEVKNSDFEVPEPEDLVPGSLRCLCDVSGNVMGKSVKNFEKLVQLPTGCGEQNMVKFDPLVSLLEVLPEDDENSKAKIKRFMLKGYQRQLRYKHSDGSFSAFGPQDANGSMILTAFVLNSFSRAADYISVDSTILSGCQDWIVSKQKPDGCFPLIGRTFDMKFQDSKEKNPLAITTAYVLKSLLTSRYDNKTVIENALSCLKKSEISSLFGTFLYANVLAQAGEVDSAKQLIEAAEEKSIKKGDSQFFQDVNATKSQRVITTAWAIQAILQTKRSPADCLSYVGFLMEEMNPQGGFYSTQDTCVALEALAKYAAKTSENKINMNIDVTGGMESTFKINEDNKMLVQSRKVDIVPSELHVEAKGSGCAVIQKTVRYNTNSPHEDKYFDIEVEVLCECKRAKISGYISYKPKGKEAGMTTATIKVPSGYSPNKESLDSLVDKSKIMRCDVEGNDVVIYFDKVRNDPIRFSFFVDQIFKVEDSQPSAVTVTNYYNPEITSSNIYSIAECEESTDCKEEP